MSTAREPKNVHQLIALVSRGVGAVGKRGRNEEAGYSFRRIEDVIDALNPVMAKHGVHVAPRVLQRVVQPRHSEDPSRVQHVALEVEFRIYGPAGDHVKVRTWGEGIDAGDKATSKAHTAALKNGLLPAFMIPTHNLTVDGDTTSPAAAAGAPSSPVAAADTPRKISRPQVMRINLDLRRLGVTGTDFAVKFLEDRGYPDGRLVPVDELLYDEAQDLLTELARLVPQTDDGAEAAPAADVPPVEPAEGTPAPAVSASSSSSKTGAQS